VFQQLPDFSKVVVGCKFGCAPYPQHKNPLRA
jgi:hypothetical protein